MAMEILPLIMLQENANSFTKLYQSTVFMMNPNAHKADFLDKMMDEEKLVSSVKTSFFYVYKIKISKE